MKTLYTTKLIRRFYKHYARNLTKDLQRKLFKANILLAVEREINTYRAEYLKRALVLEKAKRKKPKRLNLLGQEAMGKPQFYGLDKVKEARRVQAEKAAQEQ